MKKEHWLYIIIALLAIWIIASYATAPKTEAPTEIDEETGEITNETPVPGSEVPEAIVNSDSGTTNNSAIESPLTGGSAGPNKGTLTNAAPIKSAILVSNQPAGNMAKIDNVALTFDGWVVVQEQVTGTAGWILGAQRFDKGTYAGGQVELLRATKAGLTYKVMLYTDDGDKMFDMKKDTVAMDGGAAVVASFVAQ
jgi:cytoskeletal protein RodZ